MMKKLLKSLMLVWVALMAAIPSQAQTTIYERGNGTAWSDADLSNWTASYCTPTINGGLSVATTNAGWTVTKAITATENSKVTLSAKLKTGSAGGRSGSYDYIKIGGVSICFNEQDKVAFANVDGTTTNFNITYTRNDEYGVTITIDQGLHRVMALIGNAVVNATSDTEITNVEFGHYKAGRENYAINPILKVIQITEEIQADTYYDYTVNAVDGNNNVLKVIESGAVKSDENQRYVPYPQHLLIGTTLYEAVKSPTAGWYNSYLTIDKDDYVYNIPYTAGTVDDVVYYAEAEDVAGTTRGNNAMRASKGGMGYTGGTYVDATTLEPGKYQIFMRGVNGNSTPRAVKFKVGDKEVFTTAIETSTNFLDNSEEFSVTANSTLSFSSEGSSASGLDWFYVKYLGELDNGQYTVKFVLENTTTELKEAEVRDGAIGTQPTITDDDKAMFTVDEQTYMYVSDDAEGQTIADDGSTVVTITYKEATPQAYQVVAVDGNGTQLAVVAEGELYEGQSTTAYYTKAVEKDGQWYMIGQNATDPYYGVTVSGRETVNKTYAASDITWFTEIEDLTPSRSWAAEGLYPNRYSKGAARRLYKNSYVTLGNFDSGIYSVTLRARNNSASQPASLPLFLVDADGNLGEEAIGTFGEWAKAGQAEFTIDNVTIPAGCGLALNNNTDWNSNLEMDYVYIKRTGDLPSVDVTISQYGYSTLYYGDRNLVVPEGLTAYAVTVDGRKLSLTDIGGIIPAGTGVVLEGTPSQLYTLTTTNEEGLIAENDLRGTDTATEINEAGYTYYMLSVKDGNAKSIGFYLQVAGGASINNRAHCAYLPVPTDETPANAYLFIEQTDGIDGISSEQAGSNKAYTLTGVSVDGSKLQKGVYVINGKKTIIK